MGAVARAGLLRGDRLPPSTTKFAGLSSRPTMRRGRSWSNTATCSTGSCSSCWTRKPCPVRKCSTSSPRCRSGRCAARTPDTASGFRRTGHRAARRGARAGRRLGRKNGSAIQGFGRRSVMPRTVIPASFRAGPPQDQEGPPTVCRTTSPALGGRTTTGADPDDEDMSQPGDGRSTVPRAPGDG